MDMLLHVHSPVYDAQAGRLKLSWTSPAGHDLGLQRNRLEVVFAPAPPALSGLEVADIFCGCLLPHLVQQAERIVITGLPPVSPARAEFWRHYIRELVPDAQFELPMQAGVAVRYAAAPAHRTGLFFGGGVESLSLLSLIQQQQPYLLTVDGPEWMNSDYGRDPLKRQLQTQLAERCNLEFLRVWTDARTLYAQGDEYVNRFITGSLMYYLLLPLLRLKNVGVTYLTCELESALIEHPFDQSINARFLHKLSWAPDPPLLSPLNAISKVDLLDQLYHRDPQLCSYLYSCLRNSSRRWCGECGKCRRISAFCTAIGIPHQHIGMQLGIDTAPETGPITSRFWQNLAAYQLRKGQPPLPRVTARAAVPPSHFHGLRKWLGKQARKFKFQRN